MDRQLKPIHLTERIREMNEAEIAELEALLEQNEAAKIAEARLEELRIKPSTRLEYECLVKEVEAYKQELKQNKQKKPSKRLEEAKKSIKTGLHRHWDKFLVGALAISLGVGTYYQLNLENEKYKFNQAIDLNCDRDSQIQEFVLAYETTFNKKLPEPLTSLHGMRAIQIHTDQSYKLGNVEIERLDNSMYKITLSRPTMQLITERYKSSTQCRWSL
ncbi:MAG: hypothetical protein AABW48_03550 [Nanoarchaeota archaeon]